MISSKTFLHISVSLLLSSCATETEDCICTQEFRLIRVLVVDESGSPVEGLNSTITNLEGKFYNMEDVYSSSGYYAVMSDEYVHDFSNAARKIFFTASSDSGIANGEFLINTDRCQCHVQKVSGPDTLLLR
jgi:hypothetical protein